MKTRLRLRAEYECFPLWREEPDGVTNIAPEDLGLPDALTSALNEWSSRYEATYDPDDPLSSGFRSETDELEFQSRGLDLARQLAAELGDEVEVTYFDRRAGQDRRV